MHAFHVVITTPHEARTPEGGNEARGGEARHGRDEVLVEVAQLKVVGRRLVGEEEAHARGRGMFRAQWARVSFKARRTPAVQSTSMQSARTDLDGEEDAADGRGEGGGDAHGAGGVQDLPAEGREAEHLWGGGGCVSEEVHQSPRVDACGWIYL